MNKIYVFDTTLRDGEQAPKFQMDEDAKVSIAKKLAEMNIDIIEAGFPVSSPGDFEAVRRVATEVYGPVIAGLARCNEKDIKMAAEALKPAIRRCKGRIHTFIATSDLHIEKKLKKTREQVIDAVRHCVRYAKNYTPDVEFSCEDFSRSDPDYAVDVVVEAIKAGATTINLPDTVGYNQPEEFAKKVGYVIEHANKKVGVDKIIYSVHCHNDLGLATANTLAAVNAGARQVEVTVNGIGERAGNASLEEVIAAIVVRPKYYDVSTDIDTTMACEISQMVNRITDNAMQRNKAVVGENAFRHEAGIHQDGVLKDRATYEIMKPEMFGATSTLPLGPRSGKAAVRYAYEQYGIQLSDKKFVEVMQRYKSYADRVREKEVMIDTLVQALKDVNEIPERYELVSFKPWADENRGYAEVTIRVDGEEKNATGEGTGMIDAAVKAINRVSGMNLEIVDYSSKSALPGAAAEGIESVLVKDTGLKVYGFGIDTDTVCGAAKAFVDATNRMSFVREYLEK